MPEGDTILRLANRIRPVLEGRVPDDILTPQLRHSVDRWPERLRGRAVTRIDTHGKHLFLHFEGELVIHSHLRMSGAWSVHPEGDRWHRARRRAWLVLRAGGIEVIEFDGPVLELMTEGRMRIDGRLASLGPDVLAIGEFDTPRVLRRLRADDPTRGIGDALLDQRIVAGIGNIWKAEGCWSAAIDPWRHVSDVTDAEVLALICDVRPRMRRSADSAQKGVADRHVYDRAGCPCSRCGGIICARGQGDDNRTTYWCPGCQH